MSISFNSRGSSSVLESGERVKAPLHDYRLLSNLFGDVEFGYMADRFNDGPVVELFTVPGSALRDPHRFKENFRAIHPKGKPESWMRAQEGTHPVANDAADETTIAMGILAKLCGSAYKPTTEGRRRRAYLMHLAKMDESEWTPMKGELTAYEKARLMLPLLRRKFTPPGPFRQTLEGTKDAQLIERPMRGAPRLWEGSIRDGVLVGGNLLGRLLMYVRETLDKPNVTEDDDQRALAQIVAAAEASEGAAHAAAKKGTRRSPKSRPRKSPATRRKKPAKEATDSSVGDLQAPTQTVEEAASEAVSKTTPSRATRSQKSPKSPAARRTRRKDRAKAKVNAFLAEVRAAEKAQAADIDVGKMKVVELRAALKERGLPTKGLKKDLVARLTNALA